MDSGPKEFQPLERRMLRSSYFVAPNGNDAAPGTISAPWRTLQHAADRVSAGDSVTVLSGRYAGFHLTTSGDPTRRITFRAQLGVIIDQRNPTTPDGINLEGASFVTIRGFNVIGMDRAGIRSVVNTDVQIIGNLVDQNRVWGILTGFSANVLIEGNVARRSVQQHGIYVGNSADNPVIRGNVTWGNRQCGIQINADASQGGDGIVTGALVENNTIYNNGVGGGSGINLDGVQQSVVRNNLLYNNHASGISLYRIDGAQGAKGNLIINNTIAMPDDPTSRGRYAINIKNGSTGNVLRNNILYSYFPRDGGGGSIAMDDDCAAGFTSDYNVVVDAHGFLAGNTPVDLTRWRNATGQDTHSIVTTPSVLFADAGNGNYRLRYGSRAIDAGTIVRGSAIDLMGRRRTSGRAIDIGAIEFQRYVAPTNVGASSGTGGVNLRWLDNTRADAKVAIYRRTGNAAFTRIGAVHAGVTRYIDRTATAGVTYEYRLLAYSENGRSALTDPIAVAFTAATGRLR